MRYVIPLAPYAAYAHNLTVGFDYKDFRDSTGFVAGGGVITPIKYAPMLFSYNASLPDSLGRDAVQRRSQHGLPRAGHGRGEVQ